MDKEIKNNAAAELGRLGGQKTAERGPEHFRKLQAKRKIRGGGRPRGPAPAAHEGLLKIGTAEIPCAVLEDGTRVLNQAGFLRAIGRARSPKAGTGILSNADGLPFFLQAEALSQFITDELRESTKPIVYIHKKEGSVSDDGFVRFPRVEAVGYNALLLPQVCEVYLKFRDWSLREHHRVPARYQHIFQACDILMRGLAQTGIIALVDEATGYQAIRDREALQQILDRFLRKELAAWAKRFPDEFYEQMFRLRGWRWKGMKVNRPQVVGHYTNDLVYERLAPGILDELRERNPRDDKGRRKHRFQQWLTEDIGHPALAQHLYALIGFMRACSDWKQFYGMVNRAFPKKGDVLFLPFPGDTA